MNLLQKKIEKLIEEEGGVRGAGRLLQVTPQHIMRMRDGEVDKPGERILRRLGLVREVTYRGAKNE